MNILIESQNILENNGYSIRSASIDSKALIFEDESIIGMVIEIESISKLLENWEKMQDKFLNNYASVMNKEPEKAWNAYTIYLSTETPTINLKDKISNIEENLRGTRKIVAVGVLSRTDIEKALFPILPIQKTVKISSDDHLERLRNRIEIKELFTIEKAEDIFKAIENKS